eukprot:scaffold674262_cov108-Prasinocladus_malaysianus.AAC.1
MAGVFGIADAPRAESPAVLQRLRQMGVETWMVTGDNRRTANSIAEKLGLDPQFVLAEVMPGNKARQVRRAWQRPYVPTALSCSIAAIHIGIKMLSVPTLV